MKEFKMKAWLKKEKLFNKIEVDYESFDVNKA